MNANFLIALWFKKATLQTTTFTENLPQMVSGLNTSCRVTFRPALSFQMFLFLFRKRQLSVVVIRMFIHSFYVYKTLCFDLFEAYSFVCVDVDQT